MGHSQDEEMFPNRAFWKGFGIPVFFGLGSSLISSLMLTVLTIENLPFLLIFLLSSFFHLGHLIIWPSLSVLLIRKGNASGNISLKNGAIRSLKFYAVWMVVVVAPMAFLVVNLNGIV